jgi:hypothetical protein
MVPDIRFPSVVAAKSLGPCGDKLPKVDHLPSFCSVLVTSQSLLCNFWNTIARFRNRLVASHELLQKQRTIAGQFDAHMNGYAAAAGLRFLSRISPAAPPGRLETVTILLLRLTSLARDGLRV